MDIPNSVRKLMRTDHEVRIFIARLNKLEKENQLLKERIGLVEQTIRERFYKPNKPDDTKKNNIGPPKGHKANHRPKPDYVDETVDLALHNCPDCSNELGKVVETRERFIEDIKPTKPHVRKYLIHRYYCRHCEKIVYDKPKEVPRSRFGLNLLVLISFLRYGMHMPFNKIATQLDICYGMHVSEGTIQNELTRFAGYLGPEHERIKREIRELAAVNVDETGWRINGKNMWLWNFITNKHELLVIRDSRGKNVPYEILGRCYEGIVTSDCLATYANLGYKQQKCWAHLLRETGKMNSDQGKLLHSELKHLLCLAKSGNHTSDDLASMLDATINKGFTDPWCKSIVSRRLTKYRHEWFTFVNHPDVTDTNNAAERGLRQSVVMRKITGGNRSFQGARNHEVTKSVMQTWNKHGIDFMPTSMAYIKAQLS